VACDGAGSWYLAGDEEIRVFTAAGEPVRRWPTSRPAWSVAIDPEGRIWAGEQERLEVFSAEGRLEETWSDEERFGLITALAVTASEVFVADARTRWIHRLGRDRGLRNHIGDRHRKGGFHIPNGVLDFALDPNGTVVVANPGMHRVERYRPDGEALGHFGRFGQHDPAGFPGCCNPTNLALGPAGEVVVSEKAGPRVKAYDAEGRLLAVVAGAEDFDPGCKNMDLAVDGEGRIGVLDPVARVLAVYQSAGPSGVAAGTAEATS
jgi:hypothetical protein